jgi:hypothetical protein
MPVRVAAWAASRRCAASPLGARPGGTGAGRDAHEPGGPEVATAELNQALAEMPRRDGAIAAKRFEEAVAERPRRALYAQRGHTNIVPFGSAKYLSSIPAAFLKAACHPIVPDLGIVIKPSYCGVVSWGGA